MRFIEKNKKKIDPRYFLNEQTELLQRNYNDQNENEYFRQAEKVLGAELQPTEVAKIKRAYGRGFPIAHAVKIVQNSREFDKLSPEQQNARLAQLQKSFNKPEDPNQLAGLEKKTVMGAFKKNKPGTEVFKTDADAQDTLKRTFSGTGGVDDDRGPGAGAKLGQSVSGAGGTVERLPGPRTFSKPATTEPTATTPQPQKKKPVPSKLKESQDREVSYNKIKNKKNTDLFFALVNYVSSKD